MTEALIKLQDGRIFPMVLGVPFNDMEDARAYAFSELETMGLKPVKVKFTLWKGGKV